jgi:formylglycine-generating enzyme
MLMKTKIRPLFILLALVACFHHAQAQPALGIVPTNKQVLLFWPSNATSYVLQSGTNLPVTNWAFATDAVPTVYGSTAATVTNALAKRFFRLVSAPATTPDGMAIIPAGSFTIGDTLDGYNNAVPPTNVYVSAFYLDTNLVGYTQWQSVYAYATNHGYNFANAGAGKAANHPVQTVDWYDAVKWCNARSQQAGLTAVYYTDAGMTQVYKFGETANLYVNWTANGYRLPTEAEWEKAARGGLSGLRFPWGNTISETQANYYGFTSYSYDLGPNGYNTLFTNAPTPYTSPVGFFAPNNYGLYDMAGNVLEWCWDWYAAPPYPAGSPYLGGSDPRGPGVQTNRVARGGAWFAPPNNLRCADRYNNALPNTANYLYGFRCVRRL